MGMGRCGRILPFLVLALLVGCRSGSPASENAAPAPAPGELSVDRPMPPAPAEEESEALVEEEAPEERGVDVAALLDQADAAAINRRFRQASSLYWQIAEATESSSREYAEALYKITLLEVALAPSEPDLETARNRLARINRSPGGTHRSIEVASLLVLLDQLEQKDETLRRLTELLRKGPGS